MLAIVSAMVYYLYMASIVGKKQGGKTYYFVVESARVGGKPRVVSQQYLGSAEEVAARLSDAGPGEPARTRHRHFGDVAAVWSMLERLDVVRIVDEVVGPRRADAAASVGTYIALAALNRVVAPCSKLALRDWWRCTAGDRLVRIPDAALDHRRFWEAMGVCTETQLAECERLIYTRMVATFDVDMSGLALDMTNFATFVDSANDRNTIAQRGHAKQKRNDLRLVGLGLVVTNDGQIPVCSHPYPGNRPDVTQFPTLVAELVRRWGGLAADTDALTLVYDAGQDSIANQTLIDDSPLHFVTSVPPTDQPELLAVPKRRFRPVDTERYPGVSAYDTRLAAYGAEHRAVVTHSPPLHAKQAQGFEQTLTAARRQLGELAERLARGRTRRPPAAVEADVDKICHNTWARRVVRWTLTGDNPATFRLAWHEDRGARRALETEQFGKRILFTDRDDWPVADVVAAYRSQSDIEAGFRQQKDPKAVSFSPMFHWTDQKIRGHAFYCTLALAAAHLMRRAARHAGQHMSVRSLLDSLAGIQETVLLYPGERGRPRARHMLTDMNPTQQRLYDLFGLDAYAPRR